jgi:hypothetical protein
VAVPEEVVVDSGRVVHREWTAGAGRVSPVPRCKPRMHGPIWRMSTTRAVVGGLAACLTCFPSGVAE